MGQILKNKRNSTKNSIPSADIAEYGEILVNYNDETPMLFTKTNNSRMAQFVDKKYVDKGAIQYIKPTGTASVTTGSYNFAKWDYTDSSITGYTDGDTYVVRIPVGGSGYGTCLQINSLGYHPVVYNVNIGISTRYAANSTVIVTYNSTAVSSAYSGGTSISITGVWQLYDYSEEGVYLERYGVDRKTITGSTATVYQFLLNVDENHIAPVNSTKKSISATKTGFYTGEFNPFGSIIYYTSDSDKAVGTTLGDWSGMFVRYHNADLRYSFNGITNSSATSKLENGKEVYIVATPQSNGKAKLYYGESGTDYAACLTQTLPTTEDGLIYIYFGIVFDSYKMSLDEYHPVYYYKNGSLRIWTNADETLGGDYLPLSGGTLTGTLNSMDIIPTNGSTYSLGSSDKAWDNVYSSNSYSVNGFYQTSDEKLKDFQNDVDVDFDELKSIPKVYFTWKDNDDKIQMGTSAQKVEAIYPELVNTSEEGIKSVDYARLSIVALKAVDVLNERIENQEKRLTYYRDRIEELERKFKEYEKSKEEETK